MSKRSDLPEIPVVLHGKPIEHWHSQYIQTLMNLVKAEDLLRRAYNGMHKDHWKEGESESEVCAAIWGYLESQKQKRLTVEVQS